MKQQINGKHDTLLASPRKDGAPARPKGKESAIFPHVPENAMDRLGDLELALGGHFSSLEMIAFICCLVSAGTASGVLKDQSKSLIASAAAFAFFKLEKPPAILNPDGRWVNVKQPYSAGLPQPPHESQVPHTQRHL